MRGPQMCWGPGVTAICLVIWQDRFSILRDIVILIPTFKRWWGAPGSVTLVRLNGGGILLGGWATGYAWAVGGGVDYWFSDSLAIRTGADYLRTAYYDPSLVVRGQSNIRTTATVVYFFGKRSQTWR
jgi:hypothetical protein